MTIDRRYAYYQRSRDVIRQNPQAFHARYRNGEHLKTALQHYWHSRNQGKPQ